MTLFGGKMISTHFSEIILQISLFFHLFIGILLTWLTNQEGGEHDPGHLAAPSGAPNPALLGCNGTGTAQSFFL